jgi:hypothetical protein
LPKPSVTVGVLTLTLGEEAGVEQGDIYNELIAANYCDFRTAGHPYAKSPDEWVPFGDGKSVRQMIQEELKDYDVLFRSTDLDQFEVRNSAKLFVIDPLVLLHVTKGTLLITFIQEHIRTSEKAFCLILPESMPRASRNKLHDLCLARLKGLADADSSHAEFEAEKPWRLQSFLRRIARRLSGGPDPAQKEALAQLFKGLGLLGEGMAQPAFGAGGR